MRKAASRISPYSLKANSKRVTSPYAYNYSKLSRLLQCFVMLLSEFDFELPEGLIAQQPLANRADSRMLVVDRSAGTFTDRHFAELPEFLSPNDVVVLNNTKVFPAQLLGGQTGAAIEIFLVEEMSPLTWLCLARPAEGLRRANR